MKFKRDKPNENEVTSANPVPLPNLPSLNEILEGLETKVEPVVTAEFLEAAKEVMEKHKDTLAKLVDDNNYTSVALGLVCNKEGRYDVIQFAFDPRTLAVSKDVKVTPTGDSSKLVGLERLQIMMANLIVSQVLYS